MTQMLDDLARRLRSVRDLGDVVGALRALAAMRSQQAQRSLAGMRSYADIVRGALTRILDMTGAEVSGGISRPRPERPALVLFCAEYGFAGGFTRHIVETVAAEPPDRLWVVGRRGALLCEERKLAVEWSTSMATQPEAVLDTAHRLVAALTRQYGATALGPLDIICAQRRGLQIAVTRRSLLPIETAPSAPHDVFPPLLNQTPDELIGPLVEEYLFAEIAHAAMESFVSENTARLMAMETARHNIEDKLESLVTEERRLRQEETTTELFDIMTGAAAVRS
jgi:F-type H+-transporting ATPase subunit gamma